MKRHLTVVALLAGGVLGFRGFQPVRQEPRFEVPEGFAVEVAHPAGKSGSVVSITFDSQGRLVYSRERGGVVTLIDPEGDGTFEERVFTDSVTSSQGMVFDGPDLLVVGQGPKGAGLYRAVDANGDARSDRLEVVTLATHPMAEHGPHAVLFGPDGHLYWTLGNYTGIQPTVSSLSPYRQYVEGSIGFTRTDPRGHAENLRAPGGTFVRRDLRRPDSDWERVSGGFRNQYDAGFNLMGEFFTFDSDMEWDIDLPWYREVRTVHVIPGGEYGWRTGARVWPAYYPDALPPTSDVGRGSPTGVAFYQHHAYPESYRDGFLQADWSRGRILVGRLRKSGATYTQEVEDFVRGLPLNVTDVEVGPDGAVYFSMGGRDTQGGIYRVVYRGAADRPAAQPRSQVERALTLPLPRSAWGREQASSIRREMGEKRWGRALVGVARDARAEAAQRVRALELLQVFGPAPEEALLVALGGDPSWEVRAASTYYLGMRATDASRRELTRRLRDGDPMVRRRAAEALVRTGIHPAMEVPVSATEDVLPLLGDPDRWVRFSARQLLQRLNRNRWREAAMRADRQPQATEALLALVYTADETNDLPYLLGRQLELLQANPSDEELLGLVRVVQLTMLRDEGVRYTRQYGDIGKILLARFPTSNEPLNRELARTMGHLQTPGALPEIVARLDDPRSDRLQQIFYAATVGGFQAGWDAQSRDSLLRWFEKVRREEWKGGASFMGYIEYAWNDFLSRMPEADRRVAMERVPSLSPQADAGPAGTPAFRRATYSEQVSAKEIEEYLLFDPMAYNAGRPGAGVTAYQKAFCASCHRLGPLGQEFGPDLTTVGRRFQRKDLLQAILYPSHTISDLWAAEEITRRNGNTIVGTIFRETGDTVVVSLAGGARAAIPKADIRSRTRSTKSPMPEGLLNNLTLDEMKELLILLERGEAAIPDSIRAGQRAGE